MFYVFCEYRDPAQDSCDNDVYFFLKSIAFSGEPKRRR
jgi:hypothetical protein